MKWIIVLYALSHDPQPLARFTDQPFASRSACETARQENDRTTAAALKGLIGVGALPFRSRCERDEVRS